METKYKIIIVVTSLVGCFVLGRYTVPEKVRVETKVVEVEKKNQKEDIQQDKNKHKETKVVVVVKPSGEKEITKTIVEDSKSEHNKTVTDNSQISKDSTNIQEKTRESGKVTISALAGINPFDNKVTPMFGGHISKPILGPISCGVWGLSNGTMGVSAGLTF